MSAARYNDSKNHTVCALVGKDDAVYVLVTANNNPLAGAKLPVSRARSKIKNGKSSDTKFEQHVLNNPLWEQDVDFIVHHTAHDTITANRIANELIGYLVEQGFNVLNILKKNTIPANR